MFGIELKNVGKRFGANEVLRNIDLSIPKGSFTAIVGKSGCGKSTLLRVIAGLEEVTGGSLAYTGAEAKRSNIRIMFQDDRLLPWKNILKNIAIGGVNKADAEAALEKVGLRDKKGIGQMNCLAGKNSVWH